jgi:perosamine synthetase
MPIKSVLTVLALRKFALKNSPQREFIPVNQVALKGKEGVYLQDCIESGWISSEGPYVTRFEAAIAAATGRQHAVAVSSGSAALDIAVTSLGLRAGDEVIVPTHTIISCVNPIVRNNLIPILVDSDESTWNMSIADIQRKISPKTKAIMVVHTFGLPVDMDPIIDLANANGLLVIEDAAQAIGLQYKNKMCGSFGEISTLSFYPNKNITTGEGGMLLCDDTRLAEEFRSLRNLCFQKEQRFKHEKMGWNYRMSNLHAALGLAQLEQLSENVKRKREIGLRYRQALGGNPGIVLPPNDKPYAKNGYWVFGLMLAKEIRANAKDLMSRLAERGIGSRPFFWPMHKQPVFLRQGMFALGDFPIANLMGERGFYVPSGIALSQAQQQRVSEVLVDEVSRVS